MSKSMKVAIVDDEKDMRQSISQWLALSGFDTETYESAEEALKGMSSDYPGIVVSDIKMPDRNGYEVFSAARRALPDVPVILMTGFGYDPSHSIVRASQEGLQCVLFKPFQVERLLEEIRAALQKKDDAGSDSTDQPDHQTV